jgi:polysaccharide deacetylase 2 family uncharacterized protein YibQ
VIPNDELNAPLGVNRKQPRKRLPVAPVVAAALGIAIAVFLGWSLLHTDPLGGEPMVVVNAGLKAAGGTEQGVAAAENSKPEGEAPVRVVPAPVSRPPAREPGGLEEKAPEKSGGEHVVTIIDGKSGARQEVRIPSASEPVPSVAAGGDTQLIEMTKFGPIPHVGADGLRAAQAYARPFQAKSNSPQIAIVISGLGISNSVTAEALNKLPGPVTLAFAPYGTDLDRVSGRARSLGHEVLLQVPMEPFDYPDNDPGPQTLLTAATPEQNTERLQWAMSRFQGYVGIVNQMGARFSASEMSFSPILREIGKRGLIYVDDGSSARSLAGQIAGGSSLPFAKANAVIDVVPSATDIDRALVKLEGIARDTGLAVGTGSARQVTIERIASWAKGAESRGFTLVPITAAAARGKSS